MILDRQYSYGRHWIDEADINAVVGSLRRDYLSQGKALDELEQRFAEYSGAKYCLAVSSGTAGLHLASHAVGLKSGSKAWTSALTFAATANAIRYTGAKVGLIDIDRRTWNVTADTIRHELTSTKQCSDRSKGLIAVHFGGSSCDMQEIATVADKLGVSVIEDACHALGGKYRGQPIGSCQYSSVSVFSLHPVKSITAGEGGLVTTNDEEIFLRMKRARSHGVSVDGSTLEPWRAEAHSEGYNYRITEMQCALALSQLNKLDGFIAKRRDLVQTYKEQLRDLPLVTQHSVFEESAWHIFSVRFDFRALRIEKRTLYDQMLARGVKMAVHYLPVHMHKFFRETLPITRTFPEAEQHYEMAFSLPLHVGLHDNDVVEICQRLRESLGC